MRRRHSCGSNLGCSTSVAPTRNAVFIPTFWPKTWNRGSTPMTTSVVSNGLLSNALLSTFIVMLRWLSSAPLGRPVVPLVKKITAMSSGARDTSVSIGSLPISGAISRASVPPRRAASRAVSAMLSW